MFLTSDRYEANEDNIYFNELLNNESFNKLFELVNKRMIKCNKEPFRKIPFADYIYKNKFSKEDMEELYNIHLDYKTYQELKAEGKKPSSVTFVRNPIKE